MTKFGRHGDKDLIDLASEAAARRAEGRRRHDPRHGRARLRQPFNAQAGVGQQLQKQIGQTGIPVYNVANACATGATALRTVLLTIKAGEADMGLAVGVEQMGKGGLLGAGGKGDRGRKVYEPSGRYGSVMQVEGCSAPGSMPGVFAQAGMEYAYEHGGVDFEQFAKVAEKNHAHSTLNPLAHYQKQFSLDEVMDAEMMSLPEHAAHVLPEHRRLGRGRARVSEEKLRTLSKEQQQRAVKISASVLTTDPWTEHAQVQPDVNTLTRNAAEQAYETSGVDPQDLDLVELHDCFATAELIHYDNLHALRAGRGRASSSTSAARGATARSRSTCQRRPDLEGPPDRRDRHRQRLRGGDAPARRGGRPPDRGREGRAHPRHRPRLRLRRPRAREGELSADESRQCRCSVQLRPSQ